MTELNDPRPPSAEPSWPIHRLWPGSLPGKPQPGDWDILERSWMDVAPFETPYRPALVRKITNGDTFTIMLDLGFDVAGVTEEVRLLGHHCGIVDKRLGVDAFDPAHVDNTPRMRALGEEAVDLCERLMPVGSPVLVWSRVGGPRGDVDRWLALILVPTDRSVPVYQARWVSIGDLLLSKGLARVWWAGWRSGEPRP